jgi:hypothetical protein
MLPWLLGTSEDLRYTETEGKRIFGLSIIQWYVGRVFALSAVDPFVNKCFYELLTMIKAPIIVAHPRILWNVLFKRMPASPVG